MDRSASRGNEQSNVLLLDDDGSSLASHRDRLQALGYHVVKATDSSSALAIARQAAPRLIFMSVGRSGSGGASFLQALRSDDHTRHIPVAILSSGHDRFLERLGLRRVGREVW